MKKVFFIVFALVLVACGGGDLSTGTGSGGSAASTAGSSSSGGAGGDAASSSSGGGVGGEPPMASVTIVATDQYMNPASSVPVVVNDAAGTIVATSKTGADGKVSVPVPSHGSVSTFFSLDLAFYVGEVIDPPDGSTIPVTIYTQEAAPQLPEETTFLVNASEVPQSTHDLHLRDCGYDKELPVSAPVDSTYLFALSNHYCKQYPTHSFLALAFDASLCANVS